MPKDNIEFNHQTGTYIVATNQENQLHYMRVILKKEIQDQLDDMHNRIKNIEDNLIKILSTVNNK